MLPEKELHDGGSLDTHLERKAETGRVKSHPGSHPHEKGVHIRLPAEKRDGPAGLRSGRVATSSGRHEKKRSGLPRCNQVTLAGYSLHKLFRMIPYVF
jgi:hypothetical protein